MVLIMNKMYNNVFKFQIQIVNKDNLYLNVINVKMDLNKIL